MNTVEISSVISAALDSSKFWSGNIDAPSTGNQFDAHSINIAGWVIAGNEPVTTVVVTWLNTPIAVGSANLPRADVGNIFPEISQARTCGYAVTVSLLGVATEFELKVCAETTDNQFIELGTIRGCHPTMHSAFSAQLNPLMITNCLGRTGSTWLMQLLSWHPDIVIHRQYPYEMGIFRYSMHMLSVLGAPTGLEQALSPSNPPPDRHWIGHNPYNVPGLAAEPEIRQWLGHDYVEELATFCQHSAENYYRQLADSQGQSGAKYFAEKLWGRFPLMPDLVWQIYSHPAEVFYIRDPRDILCSVLAFNAKRGYPSFHYERARSDYEYVEILHKSTRNWLESWKRRQDKAILLRYETLIQDPHAALSRMFDYLNIDNSAGLVNKIIDDASQDRPEMEFHRTSPDVSSSIGRWKRDLSDRHKAICQEVLADVLQELDYSSS